MQNAHQSPKSGPIVPDPETGCSSHPVILSLRPATRPRGISGRRQAKGSITGHRKIRPGPPTFEVLRAATVRAHAGSGFRATARPMRDPTSEIERPPRDRTAFREPLVAHAVGPLRELRRARGITDRGGRVGG